MDLSQKPRYFWKAYSRFRGGNMKAHATIPTYKAIPTYKLYGENTDWPTPELLHHESIAERSAIHEWIINPHRHNDLFQMLYMRRGSARLLIDDRDESAVLPCLVLVPPLYVHGFVFSEDIEGHVLTFPDMVLDRFIDAATGQRHHFNHPHVINSLQEQYVARFDTVFRDLAAEFASNRPTRLLALEVLLGLVLVYTVRLVHGAAESSPEMADKGIRHLLNFQDLINVHYRRGWSIEDYAAHLGISSTRLNELCRQYAGRCALQLVHDRIMLEAKRNLIYTVMTVSEIAYSLGFKDPAYFSRFFTRLAGYSPVDFRKRQTQN